jgi:flavodoxin
MSKNLVAYFSASGVTEKVAKNLSSVLNCDIYEIKPAVKYTSTDLNWLDNESRSSVEMRNLKSRPEMAKDNFSIKEYDTIFLGFPIWWYIAPTIVNTFLEKHDFSNKKIILFATSGGSQMGSVIENLKPSVSESTIIIEGKVLNHNPSIDDLKKWVEELMVFK